MKAVFLDRDGVINLHKSRIDSPGKLEIFDFSADAIKKLSDAGFGVYVVTNQPEVAKGFFSLEDLEKVHNYLKKKIPEIDEIYFCPHHPEKGWPGEVPELKKECECRKPNPGLLLRAAEEHGIDLGDSWMVGDSISDIVAGNRAGVRTIYVTEGGGSGAKQEANLELKPDYTCKNLKDASEIIRRE